MADHSGNLAQVEDGKSLLPEIVRKELELEQELTNAETTAASLIKEAQKRRDEAIEAAKAGFPESEQSFLEQESKKFEKELEDLKVSEQARLDTLRSIAEPRVAAAADAIVAHTLDSQN
jgi:vacuolar-type H+-ATPase subunit H